MRKLGVRGLMGAVEDAVTIAVCAAVSVLIGAALGHWVWGLLVALLALLVGAAWGAMRRREVDEAVMCECQTCGARLRAQTSDALRASVGDHLAQHLELDIRTPQEARPMRGPEESVVYQGTPRG